MAKLVESVYGDALFEYAIEHEMIDDLVSEVGDVLGVLEDNPDFIKVMTHPRITKEEKKSLVETVFKGKISDDLLGLFITIVDKGHFGDIQRILRYFVSRVREYKNIGVAYITTPVELSAAQKADVEKRLLETTGYTTIEAVYNIDQALIGGMVIRIGDHVVDSSVKTKIEHLSRDLAKIQLKVGEGVS
ncbi:MAG: ATP synthase F1 subunit delta [Lachnospiraceae bacterium]|nr:ATP synthase F1 subunit delta [Lachnospiraceae bacterium]